MYYTLIRLGTDFPKWSPISTLGRQWYRYDSSTQFLEWDKLGLPCSNMLKTCIYPANPSSSSSSKHDCISEEHNSIFACVIASKYTYLHISHICISSQIYIYICTKTGHYNLSSPTNSNSQTRRPRISDKWGSMSRIPEAYYSQDDHQCGYPTTLLKKGTANYPKSPCQEKQLCLQPG